VSEAQRFGRYVVVERLGAGAMGAVYRARDEALGRDVAVKTIHAIGLIGHHAEIFQGRFANEARAVAALSHPHVVEVFDVGVENGVPYLVMALCEGPSLAARLGASGALGAEEARALCGQIAAALAAAHARGIVHRDVKPANVLEAAAGTWKLADFGVAHVPDSSLTLSGQFLGSPAYAAPEAIEQGAFGPASDVYGLGATLYEALCGEPPFGDGGLLTVGALAAGARPVEIAARCPGLPPDLAAAVMGALARDPSARPDAAALARIAHGPQRALAPVAAPRSRRAAAFAGVAALLLAGMGLGAALTSGGGRDDAAPTTVGPIGGAPAGAPPAGHVGGPPGHRGYDPPGRRHVGGPPGGDPPGQSLRRPSDDKRWSRVLEDVDRGDLGKAAERLADLLERDPHDAEARRLQQELHAELASPVYAPDRARRWARVEKKLRDGERGDARKELRKLLARYPDHAEARALDEELRTRHGRRDRRR
jgi:eukaryotic-like serine/threonine-protein kinase